MITPITPYIILTLPNQQTVRCTAFYLQAQLDPWLQPAIDLDIHYTELLPIGVYEAVLTDGAESMSGQYHIHDHEEAEYAQGWLFFGTFAHVLTDRSH